MTVLYFLVHRRSARALRAAQATARRSRRPDRPRWATCTARSRSHASRSSSTGSSSMPSRRSTPATTSSSRRRRAAARPSSPSTASSDAPSGRSAGLLHRPAEGALQPEVPRPARAYGPQVGLLTGDNAIDADAPIVVMTTEVLRNMLYARSRRLDDLGLVVLDEVHFLQDTYRGPVWEEVIIHLPPDDPADLPVGDGQQHRRAGGVDPDGARADDTDRRAAPTGAPARPLPRRRPDQRPHPPAADVRRRPRQPRRRPPRRVGGPARRPPVGCAAVVGGCSSRRHGWRSSTCWPSAGCCRPSSSSSAATSATRQRAACSPPGSA